MHQNIILSKGFKQQTTKAILAILLFILVYLILFAGSITLTMASVYIGISVMSFGISIYTILLGIGLISFGLMVFFFLIKFLFKSHKIDRSHLIEIFKKDEPELFNTINEIVNEVGTHFPKKVYLASDVNAYVFYDSSFWSMFLPIKKNLVIGLGLTNAVSKDELRAILAHEFGHFSQKTMKVGSYVYNVNQVIFNMLHDNDAYESIVGNWAKAHIVFSVFANIAMLIIKGIQWVLARIYGLINLSYMGLSREMEFHADEVAAHVTGSKPLQTSLMRLDFASYAFETVLGYYDTKIKENIKSPNIYSEQQFIMSSIAQKKGIKIENELPQINLDLLDKYNKSKLVIKDQWASHPSTKDRVNRLEQLNLKQESQNDESANLYFSNALELQKMFTKKIFDSVQYEGTVQENNLEQFEKEHEEEQNKNSFPETYNGYYNDRNPIGLELNLSPNIDASISVHSLFANAHIERIEQYNALYNDIQIIQQIKNEDVGIKSFDYDGVKYRRNDSSKLLKKLNPQLEDLQKEIINHDEKIYQFFLAKEASNSKKLKRLYSDFHEFDISYLDKMQLLDELTNQLHFVPEVTPYYLIESNFLSIENTEKVFKSHIQQLLDFTHPDWILDIDAKESFEKYLSKKWVYFEGDTYYNENLDVLYIAIHNFRTVLMMQYFTLKKALLEYQISLV